MSRSRRSQMQALRIPPVKQFIVEPWRSPTAPGVRRDEAVARIRPNRGTMVVAERKANECLGRHVSHPEHVDAPIGLTQNGE